MKKKTAQEIYYENKLRVRENIKECFKGLGIVIGMLVVIGIALSAIVALAGGFLYFDSRLGLNQDINSLQDRVTKLEQNQNIQNTGIFVYTNTWSTYTWPNTSTNVWIIK